MKENGVYNNIGYKNDYLKYAFEELGKSQKEIIEDLGKSQPYVSALMKGKKQVGKNIAKVLNELYGFDELAILKGVIPNSRTQVGDITNTGGNVVAGNVVAGNTGSVNIGNEERENVVPQGELKPKQYAHTLEVRLVTNKAKAGWSDGYYNEEYLQDMPIVVIDADENYKGKYLAFEVAGDSMEPDYLEGDIVICREVQRHLWNSKLHFKDWDFVIAHSTQGIMLKEIIDHNVETGDIVCRSINPKHKDFTLNLREIAHLYNVVEVRQKGRQKRWNRAKDFFEN